MPVSCTDYLIEPAADPESLLRGLTLPAVFAAAGRDPDAIAITDQTQSLTWREWRVEVDAVAYGLQATGVRPGDVVAVQLPNCIDYETLHLAIAAVGAVLRALPSGSGRTAGKGPAGRGTAAGRRAARGGPFPARGHHQETGRLQPRHAGPGQAAGAVVRPPARAGGAAAGDAVRAPALLGHDLRPAEDLPAQP